MLHLSYQKYDIIFLFMIKQTKIYIYIIETLIKKNNNKLIK